MGKTIGKTAERKLRELLQRGLKLNPHHVDGRGSPRFDIHVKVTGGEIGGYYPCITTDFNCATETWNEYTATSYCFGANEEPLATGKRYRAINYGIIDDALIFVVDANTPEAGCHLTNNGGELAVTPNTLAGNGLEVQDDSGCDKLAVKGPGCGLRFTEDGTLALDMEAIAFDGLYGDNENCFMGVNVECGLQYVGTSGIGVNYESLAGDGLKVDDDSDSDSDSCQSLAVNPACGLYIDSEKKLHLDVEQIAGAGLIGINEYPEPPGCPQLFFDLTKFTYTDIPIVESVTLSGGGCSMTQSVTIRTWRFWKNPVEVLVGVESTGSVTTNTNVEIGCCCDSLSSVDAPILMMVAPQEQPPLEL